MLQKVKLSQFGGINTILDSSNAGVSSAREATNLILRPMGALSVPPAWTPFAPGGTALDLGFITNVDFLFDGGRLLLQDNLLNWWDVTPDGDGAPRNAVVAYGGATISTDLAISSSQILAFKVDTNYIRLGADSYAMGWFFESIGITPSYNTRYTTDQAFVTGKGPVFTDGAGNKWRLQADPATGIYAITIA